MPEIFSVNQEPNLSLRTNDLNKSRVKFEMVNNFPDPPKAKGSGIGKFFKALGAVSPLGLFFGPLGWVGAAAGQGLAAYGNNLNAKAAAKQLQPEATPSIATPGFGGSAMDPAVGVVAASKWSATQSAVGGM